jgi:hypothetical protein
MTRIFAEMTMLALLVAACSSDSTTGTRGGTLRDGGETGGGSGQSGGTSVGGGGPSSGGSTGAGGAASTGGAQGATCKTGGECLAPAICMVCSDGRPSCATTACVAGHCTVSYPPCGTGAGGAGGAAGDLKWFTTCGPPVCRTPQSGDGGSSSGIAPCTTEKAGAACPKAGTECDPGAPCSGPLMCAASDPTHGGQCPVSRAKYKTDIRYVDPADRAKLAADLQSIPLVRYRYKDGPEREHLGFIIEDVEPSPGVDSPRDQVDLYGYTSMAVAAIQEQHRQILDLEKQLAELRAEVARQRAKRP